MTLAHVLDFAAAAFATDALYSLSASGSSRSMFCVRPRVASARMQA